LISSLPVGELRRSLLVVFASLNSESSALLSGSGQTSQFSSLVDWLGNPVVSGVVSDGIVVRVAENDFVEFVCGVLGNPVRVEDTESTELSADSFFSDRAIVSLVFKLGNTLTGWLTVDNTLGDWFLSATSADSDSVDNDTLLGLVSESSGLIRSGWLGNSVDSWELSVFPVSETEDESHHV